MTALAVVAAVAGVVTQAVTGFGFSLVCAPFLVVTFGPVDGVRLVNILALTVNVVLLAREHHGTRVPDAVRLLIPAALVAPLAAWVVRHADEDVLTIVAGVLVLLAAAALATGARWRALRGTGGVVVAGGVSAAMNVASGVGGPAVAMYALNAGWPPTEMRPTLQLYFLGLNVISIAALGPPDGVGAGSMVGLLGGVLVGFVLGGPLARRADAAAVRRTALLVAAAGGAVAIARGLF